MSERMCRQGGACWFAARGLGLCCLAGWIALLSSFHFVA